MRVYSPKEYGHARYDYSTLVLHCFVPPPDSLQNDGRGRGAPLLPPPPPIVAKDPGGKKRSGARSSPSLASEPVESVEDSLSPCSSGSEDSEDSDSVLWNSGGGRGNRGRGRGRSVAAAGKGQRQQGSEVKGASRVASDVAVRGGEGGGEGEGRGEGSENDDEDGDEADEDIHARLVHAGEFHTSDRSRSAVDHIHAGSR